MAVLKASSFLFLAAATTAAAQTGSQPTMVLTISAGVITGHPLWGIPKQPICLPGGTGQCGASPTYDTLSFRRTVGGGLMGGVAASFFPGGAIGWQVEMNYLAPTLENACTPVYVSSAYSQQICDEISGSAISAGTLALYGGVTARVAARRAISPYIRGGVGLTIANRSTLALESTSKAVVIDNSPDRMAASFHLGIGLTAKLGPGYQYRIEVRDILATQQRLDGPVNSLGQGPTSSRTYSHFALTMGLDVVLEKKRGRRY